jgi:hypothetical protein
MAVVEFLEWTAFWFDKSSLPIILSSFAKSDIIMDLT